MGHTYRSNNPDLGWVVQKFGGTSVGKFPVKIVHDIVRASLSKNRVVVVCSARSTEKKKEGTTSRLLGVYEKLKAVNTATTSEEEQQRLVEGANGLILSICNDHIFAAESYISDEELRKSLIELIKNECQELIEYIAAAKRFNLEINARSKDRVVSFGEKLSCLFMTTLLKNNSIDAEYVDLSELFFADSHSRLDHSFFHEASSQFAKRLLACENRVPVITGFFGNVPGSLMEGDIGRGYTDLCAALCAVGLKADELQIWKEVDGIFTADPTKVPTASLLSTITPSEAAELTFYGSEVIHHLTMDQVMRATPPIPIRIKNVNNPRGNGTLVYPRRRRSSTNGSLTYDSSSSPGKYTYRKPKRPTAVSVKDNITVLNIHSNKRSLSHGFFARIFGILDRYHVSVDLISTSEVHVSLAIHTSSLQSDSLLKAQKALEECGEVSMIYNMAILSLVGADMKHMVGIAGRMFSVLGDHQINLEMISQGASEINISCVIQAKDATMAMNVLHTHLFTFLD